MPIYKALCTLQDHIFPEALGLQLEADEFNVCNSFER